jgi:preprotein translocase subunit SecE
MTVVTPHDRIILNERPAPSAGRNRIMAKTNPLQFMQQVRQEAEKVTWPTRKETMITTIMVMIMVALAAVFFLGVDAVLSRVVNAVLLYGL